VSINLAQRFSCQTRAAHKSSPRIATLPVITERNEGIRLAEFVGKRCAQTAAEPKIVLSVAGVSVS